MIGKMFLSAIVYAALGASVFLVTVAIIATINAAAQTVNNGRPDRIQLAGIVAGVIIGFAVIGYVVAFMFGVTIDVTGPQ